MPKQRITKEMVVDAAFQLAREGGMERVLVKDIAARLGCSVQPIYSCCQSMEGLRRDVLVKARDFVRSYLARDSGGRDAFQATGRNCVRLAKEEPHLFRLYTLSPREGVSSLEEFYRAEAAPGMAGLIAEELGVGEEQARRLHLNMLIYTVGLSAIFSTAKPGIPADEIFGWQSCAYQAFLDQLKEEDKDER